MKKKVQSKISSTKQRNITFSENWNKNNDDDDGVGGHDGQDIEWSDDMDSKFKGRTNAVDRMNDS